ncbi:MAG: c-di-GMP-related signal transduction protein, partial [Planctomycetota bacterium]
KARYLEFLREMSRPNIDLERLEQVIKAEPSLAAKLLRYLNSAHFGLKNQMHSIKQALTYLGERPLKRWATLVALTGLGDDKPPEIVSTCLIRAHFCEAMASPTGTSTNELDLFLTGMFSAVDALVDRPLEEVLTEIGLPDKVLSAIVGDDTDLSRIYSLVRATELGDKDEFDSISEELGVESQRVARAYAEAVMFTQRLMGMPDDVDSGSAQAS